MKVTVGNEREDRKSKGRNEKGKKEKAKLGVSLKKNVGD